MSRRIAISFMTTVITAILSFPSFVCLAAQPAEKTASIGQEAGSVLTIAANAFVERGGQRTALTGGASVYSGDTLSTDSTGRVRILFNDDTTLSLGPDTSLNLREYVESGSKPMFRAHLLQGVTRIITGRITEKNPDGFALTSPEAAIGIRGTIVSMRSRDGVSTVFVENTMRRVYVNNILVPGGNKITVPDTPARPIPIDPRDRRDLGRDLAFHAGGAVAAAAPEPGLTPARREETPLAAGTALPEETRLAGLALQDMASLSVAPPAITQTTVTPMPNAVYDYFGAPYSTTFGTVDGLGFTVNLGSGSITSGHIKGSVTSGPLTTGIYVLDGGTGSASGGSFSVMGFTPMGPSTASNGSFSGTLNPGDPSGVVNFVGLTDGINNVSGSGLSIPITKQ
ncbi:MAG: FecR domain-containing protein [Desulfovibrio sp.]|jgi:hypothetical protein|nr:FecR domain-containing protein [Desulfovibrio sp.]